MKDKDETKDHLVNELAKMRQRMAKLETSEIAPSEQRVVTS